MLVSGDNDDNIGVGAVKILFYSATLHVSSRHERWIFLQYYCKRCHLEFWNIVKQNTVVHRKEK